MAQGNGGSPAGKKGGSAAAGKNPGVQMGKTPAGPSAGQAAAGKTPAGKSPAGKSPAGKSPAGKSPAGKSPAGKAPASKATGRQSVAAARKSKPGSNRTQLIIGVVAVVVIAIIVVIGLVLNKKQTATQADGYGPSVSSTATVANGVASVTKTGVVPSKFIDIYEDALCPYCAELEHQYGQQINQYVDEGKLGVRYHMLNFLNPNSASKDYSTRAAAALLCVAADKGAPPGAFMKYHTNLFATGTQPTEGASTDLTNAQLASLATANGATAAATGCITSGSSIKQAETTADAAKQTLVDVAATTGSGSWGTPTVLVDGKPLDINTTSWLSNVVG